MKGLCKAGQCQISSFYGIERGLHLLLDSTGISIRGWKSMAWMANGDKDLHLSTFKWIGACNLFKKTGRRSEITIAWPRIWLRAPFGLKFNNCFLAGNRLEHMRVYLFRFQHEHVSTVVRYMSLSLSQYIQVIYVHKWYMHTICYNMYIYNIDK